jgi:hypothetical protein
MANPAQLLLDQFHAWRNAQATAEKARNMGEQPEGWTRHRVAVRHIDALDEILTEMEAQGKKVAVYRKQLPAWTAIAFGYPLGWNQANSGKIDATTLHHLETLAGRLEDYLPLADDAGRERTRNLVESVRAAISDDDSVPAELRIHLTQMADQLGWCLDRYEITGDFELKNAIDRLLITIGVTAQRSNNGGIWTKIANEFVSPFIVGTAAQITGSAMLMLISGAG